jgi:hypothetical protein
VFGPEWHNAIEEQFLIRPSNLFFVHLKVLR